VKIVDEAIRNWENERAGVMAEVESIPEEHFDFRPAEGARSVRELAVHIAEAGLMLAAEILRTDGSFLRFFEPNADPAQPTAHSKAEILALLRTTGADTTARLRAAGESLGKETMETFHGEESRLTALWFAVGHEMYHCGQLASYARTIGQVPALTRKLTAMMTHAPAPGTAA
jgi:uncharacterized damage-inducible protein DinB